MIDDCRYYSWGRDDCGHNQIVSVSCNASVRLVGGPSPREGRLELHHNGTWGTVCWYDHHDHHYHYHYYHYYHCHSAARVVCHMLGYGRIGRFVGNRYGAGSGRIWLDNLWCRGTETNIGDCQHNVWGSHNSHCGHHEVLSVSCNASVRLVGGPSPREGLLEVDHNGTWGTVCNDGFTNASARVVCFMLGNEYSGRVIANRYGAGNESIWLDDVQCNGTEPDIGDCRHGGWGQHKCGHNQDVTVSCNTVRLVDGPSPREGRLEVEYNGTWGTVCDDGFTHSAARVVCLMLAYDYSGRAVGNRYGAGSGPIWLDDVDCNGTETDIRDCRHRGWGRHNCEHSQDVSVSCDTSVRLVGGPSPREGRLEVYRNGTRGSMCSIGFTHASAKVVC